jgi:hypothetical protein
MVTSLNSLPIFFILIRGVLPIVFNTEVSAMTGQVGVWTSVGSDSFILVSDIDN